MKRSKKNAPKELTKRVLVVVTSTSEYLSKGYRTGLWLGELTHFYDKVEKAGYPVTIASIDGGQVPLDPESLSTAMLKYGGTGKRYADRSFMKLLSETVSVRDVAALDYDAIYLAGGHGTMYDFDDPALTRLVGDFAEQEKIISAVCHGPAGLLHAVKPDGSALLEGRKATGFSWAEEKLAGRRDSVPFRLDTAMKKAGAKYTKAWIPMKPKVVRDGLLITGQNPTSAGAVADEVVKLLRKM